MNQLIGMFLPAVLGIYIYEKLIKRNLKFKEWFIKYFILVLFTNVINYGIEIYIFKKPLFIFTNLFTLKYLLLGIVVSIIISVVFVFFEKNIELNLRVEKNEK